MLFVGELVEIGNFGQVFEGSHYLPIKKHSSNETNTKALADCIYFLYIGGSEDLGKSKEGELKMQKSRDKDDENTLEIQGGGDKEEKIHGRRYEIMEKLRGGGDKKAKIQGRLYPVWKVCMLQPRSRACNFDVPYIIYS